MNFYKSLAIVFLVISFGLTESLYDAYQNAGPANGFDKYLVLNPDSIYTGGIGTFEESMYIDGNGAVIDLKDGAGIWAYGEGDAVGTITIKHCSVINGSDTGINFTGIAQGEIVNCNFHNNSRGIQAGDFTEVTVTNCNVSGSDYGIAMIDSNAVYHISYCNTWDNRIGDYMKDCFG
ncbi:MAG: right-handed parallel beta-helix repeat-containing protein [Candidatus Marinimicrobia bacterium]|nr:right-handed parallel beta-helix repeat-containing protein [Candidatus Neomarinimicrobiota bacterium]MBL7022846.1 right-handed parallel beta-helix repeat-containing protein [Candidatus Neomarinimicrobiota bacterium]MBL7110127.1 right-handed parallel beta-helix repeat-containing protein [Candidatus Neomarinimicrobiota bacterium]